eukprot:scaffold106_cov380-Prasinococcus_capsulatus_cf.AAC.24
MHILALDSINASVLGKEPIASLEAQQLFRGWQHILVQGLDWLSGCRSKAVPEQIAGNDQRVQHKCGDEEKCTVHLPDKLQVLTAGKRITHRLPRLRRRVPVSARGARLPSCPCGHEL